MAAQLLEILKKTTDAVHCREAQTQLEQAAKSNLPEFLVQLSVGQLALLFLPVLFVVLVLANPQNDELCRFQAALQLKNHLVSNNNQTKMEYQQRWLMIDKNLRDQVKTNSFNALGSETR